MALSRSSSFARPTWRLSQQVANRWGDATAGKHTARQRILCRDRKAANRHFNVVFFDSYESAVENSNLPETQRCRRQANTDQRAATEI
jgi:hypothetical protein